MNIQKENHKYGAEKYDILCNAEIWTTEQKEIINMVQKNMRYRAEIWTIVKKERNIVQENVKIVQKNMRYTAMQVNVKYDAENMRYSAEYCAGTC